MRSFDRMGSRYLEWRLWGAGVASLLAVLDLMRSGSDEPYAYGGPPFAWGLTDPVAVLSAWHGQLDRRGCPMAPLKV